MELAAGICACFAAVELISKSTKSLRRISKQVKGAKDDIRTFECKISMTCLLIEGACITLEPYSVIPEGGSWPEVLQFFSKNHVFQSLVKTLQSVTDEICDYIPVIEKLQGIPKLIVYLKWVSRKKSIDSMVTKMESVKSSFGLVVSIVNLAAIQLQPQDKANRTKIRRLKHEIKVHIREKERLQQRLKTNQAYGVGDLEAAFVSQNQDVQAALEILGRSMLHKRRFPEHPPLPTSPTGSSISRAPRSLINHPHTPNLQASPSFSHTLSRARIIRPSTSTVIPPTRSLQQRYHSPPPVNHTPPLESRSLAPETLVISSAFTRGSTESAISQPPQSDFLAVHENNNLIHLDPATNYQAESGYIATPSGPLFTTAKLDESLSENLITQSFAIAHDLEIEPLDMSGEMTEDEGLWIQIGNGRREHCVGKVALQWSMGAFAHKPEFPVHCWVFVHGVDAGYLVFGRRYVEKKAHYRRLPRT